VVALTLFGFVLVATSVIWRRTFGYSQTRAMQRLERQRQDLRSQRAQLLSRRIGGSLLVVLGILAALSGR
jgi:hypothetical protein